MTAGPAGGQALSRIAAALVCWLAMPRAASAEPGDAARGERVFQFCYSCHSVDPAEKAKLQGPSLYRIIGRPAAALPSFDYSDAMKERTRKGLVWEPAILDAYIADPEGIVPGTRMSAQPLRDAQDRADLIAYLARSGNYRR